MKIFLFLMAIVMSCHAKAQIDSLLLDEVVVTGTRNATDVRHLPLTVTVVGRDILTEQHQTNILPAVMQQVPGLMITHRSMMGYGVSTGAAGGINLRGITGGSGQLLVLIDGHPQYNGVYGHPISDSYQMLMTERVEVLRGPASVLYGSNAMGGVLNIVTRSMREDGVKTSVNLGAGSYGTVQAEISNQVRSGRFSSTVAVQYGRSDNHRPRMGFEQYVGYAKIGYDLSAHWDVSANANITHFNASCPGTTASPLYDADQWITRGMVSAALKNHYQQTNGSISVYSNFGRHKIDDGSADPVQPTERFFQSKDALTGVSLYQNFQLFDASHLTLGVDYQHIYGNAYYTSKQTGEILDTPNKQSGKSYRNVIAGYMDFRQDISTWLTVDVGIRVDHHSVTGTEWVPQTGIVIRPLSSGEMKLMAGKGFRNPTMREMYLYPPSNEELEPERIWNYEASWTHRVGDFFYGANFYYIKGDNMIQTIDRKNVNTGEIENYGAELDMQYRINEHWSLTSNHSFLHMKNKIIAAPEYKGVLGIRSSWGHVQKKKHSYDRWNVLANLQYIDGLYTAVGTNEIKENFCLFNVTVNYTLNSNTGLWLRGENLFGQDYEINQGYPMPSATFMGGINIRF